MAFVPGPFVPAPEPRGLRQAGLLTAAAGPLDLPAHGRAGGIRYEPVSCGYAHLYPVECTDEPEAKTFDDGDGVIDAAPFVAYASYLCGSVGYTQAELEAKVRRRLANGEQTIAEAALADVLATDAVPLTAPDPTDLAAVFGELEAWLYGIGGAAYGNTGYLHAPVRLASYAQAHHLLVADGPLVRTRLGTVVVFGGGYPDDGTVYATGHVTVWRDPQPFVYPIDQTFDRTNNQHRLLAEREYAVAYDCVAAAATFEYGAPS